MDLPINGRAGKHGNLVFHELPFVGRFTFLDPDAGSGAGDGSAGAGGSGGSGGGQGSSGGQSSSGAPEGYLSPEQVNKVVQERLQRERNKLNGELDKRLSEMGLSSDSVNEFKTWKENKEKEELERKQKEGKFQEIIEENRKRHTQELQDHTKKYQDLQAKYETTVVRAGVLGVAAENGAIAPEEVFLLTRDRFKVKEDGTLEVLNERGEPAYDSQGKPHTPKSFLVEWLQSRPHFLKASGAGGSGASGAGKGGNSSAPGYQGQKFRRSQLRNREFYKANREAILAAQREGNIINDV